MNAVGYDLYCKMLSEAVKEAKGIHTMEDFETTIDLNMDAFIPDSYISNEYQKLDIYKRIAGIETQQDYDDMLEELDTRDACEKVRQCVQTCLSPRERKIITLRYGLGGQAPHTQREIAAQCGISRSYVSRIEKRALEKLQEGMQGWVP